MSAPEHLELGRYSFRVHLPLSAPEHLELRRYSFRVHLPLSAPGHLELGRYSFRVHLPLTSLLNMLYFPELDTRVLNGGDGVAQWVERRTQDPKDRGWNPISSTRKI